jgi:integrase
MATIRKRQWKNKDGETATRWTVDFYDLDGKRGREDFESRKEADAFRIEIEDQLRKGTYRTEAGKVTVREGAERFLGHCRERLSRGERMTRRNFAVYEGYVRNYICPDPAWHAAKHAKARHAFRYFDKGIGSRTLAQVTVGVVTQFRDDLRNFGVSVPTTRKILAMLQVMFKYLASLDLMAVNPAREVEVIGRREETARRIIPPDKELVRALIGEARANFVAALTFAAATGIRAGELHALRWKHLNFKRREVQIETRVDAYGDEDVPKTVAGVRNIPLGENVLALLKEWRMRSAFSAPDDLVFPNRHGGYLDHDNMVRDKFEPLFARVAARWKEERRVDPVTPFTWHALRHFAISCWIEAGLPPKTIQTFAGHSSLQVTMDRYGHLFRSEQHGRIMDAIADEVYAPQPERPPQPRDTCGRYGRDP